MIASGFAQNGAKVYIASRKEAQLKEVSDVRAFRMYNHSPPDNRQRKSSTEVQRFRFNILSLISA